MQHSKVKSVSKTVTPKGNLLASLILSTMKRNSDIVGSTLGPGGSAVLIERQEYGLPPLITKDGVTVFKNLGYEDATQHCIMEAARDASVRTANEAGDGTTTATVLSEAIVRNTMLFCERKPNVSPQKVVRKLESTFKNIIQPTIESLAMKREWHTEDGQKLLKAVASVSANGDTDLADKVIECFSLVGDDGNVTIAEVTGNSKYEVEKVEGFPIGIGYEDSCARYYNEFINDTINQRVEMENPIFLLYNGKLNSVEKIKPIIEIIATRHFNDGHSKNLVIVAHGFSDEVLGTLAINIKHPQTINVFPLVVPQSPLVNGAMYFLQDLAAITSARIMDPINNPIENTEVEDLGFGDSLTLFESYRFRSTIVGHVNDDEVSLRADELKCQIENAASELDKILTQERLGKLTGGIARLKVIGPTSGETKEKRDRAEDAVCAVRGAIKHGCLPGGGWALLAVCERLMKENDEILSEVLIPSLTEPVKRILQNCGYSADETKAIVLGLYNSEAGLGDMVFDALEGKYVDPIEGGILDSTPAVLEAIRNSLSIATLLGTLGGTVVFARDTALEYAEARSALEFDRDSHQATGD
ncbi:GroL Chaperonin GroEL (HSP60 family) [uncultured Caudovirales phage]|uniref:GroL Chaperonin GroEL (HSP60 family) n=1 Tax=uncultured Caudovirales phage TaxID=2100421 RepID=A0A6J5L106_9CAUD|nr:GroL Chaperonin GroEL (HSP60 family) [uncultured Caudovirales phage]